ncbi:MAG TPA: hypothetical protein VNO70_26150 [Blastocatellia bacterium]|nr:hypothetical protein [Blastocatellia bacterium]
MRKTAIPAILTIMLVAMTTSRAEAASQQGLFVSPVTPVAVAPNQPPVAEDSTRGIINALCDVTLNIVGCGFNPDTVTLACDSNGDGVPEATITLQNITRVNGLLVRATLSALAPQLPGTAFPLACCGGTATLTLSRTVPPGPGNVFGEFTQKVSCEIDLGLRAPVVISATPSGGNCATTQNLLIPGSCFLQPDGTPNVTSVFAVNAADESEMIQATSFVITSTNLIAAAFDFGAASAGKTFLIFVSGPNGTSRNLTALPAGAPAGCPLGNEQGVKITFTCQSAAPPDDGDVGVNPPLITSCDLKRSSSGTLSLVLVSNGSLNGFKEGSTMTVGGVAPKKIKFKDQSAPGVFNRVVLKGGVCQGLPGVIVVTLPDGKTAPTFQCNESCQ